METVEQFKALAQRIALFKKIDMDDVARIFVKGMTMIVQKENVIFYQNTTGNTMYVILSGKVDLYDGKKHLTSLGEGDMFGEMALISTEPRSATAMAAEDTHLFVLTEETFHKLMTKRVAVQMLLNIVGILSARLRDTNKKLTRLQRG